MTFAPGTFFGLSDSEVALFRQLLTGLDGSAVEIGCMDGYSTAHILECSQLRVTCIDPFIPDSCEPQLIGSKERFWQNVEPWRDRVTLLDDYSESVASWWTGQLDFLFIDGDHRCSAVLHDMKRWAPWVNVGGLLAMHDARVGRPDGPRHHIGPSAVADDLVFGKPNQWEIAGESHSLVVARKRT